MRRVIIGLLMLFLAAVSVFAACSGDPEGLSSPRQLTDAEKEKVVAAALGTPEVKAQLKKEPTYKTSLNWIAIVWDGSQASEWRVLDYDWEKDPNFALVTRSSVFYAHVLFNFGEPPQWQMYIAVNPDTGKAFMVTENPYRTGPTPPAPVLEPAAPEPASDDIVYPPGGFTYRANVHQEGQPDWPPVRQTEVALEALSGTVAIQYRDYIETKAGETRNNIIFLNGRNAPELLDPLQIEYTAADLPDGMTLERDRQMYGGIGGQDKASSRVVLLIHIAPQVVPGEYPFTIHLSYEGKELGSLPCVIKVIE